MVAHASLVPGDSDSAESQSAVCFRSSPGDFSRAGQSWGRKQGFTAGWGLSAAPVLPAAGVEQTKWEQRG